MTILKITLGWKPTCLACLLCAAAIGSQAQTFQTLVNFNGTNGKEPFSEPLVQGTDGNLYGTTYFGGGGQGNIFEVSTDGVLTTLYNFCSQTNCIDGAGPAAGLFLSSNGNFYGTAMLSGANDYGTVFEVTTQGVLTTLHDFNNTDGADPYAALVQGIDGSFYGTTFYGGSSHCGLGCGTVFKLSGKGVLTTLHVFVGNDGANSEGALIQANDGSLYGTTVFGGSNNLGTIFKITPGGTFTTVHRFGLADGNNPYDALLQASDGNFYGTTAYGGKNDNGTVFRITSSGSLTTVHFFISTDGAHPLAGLIQATDGNFYGSTTYGGNTSCFNGCGTVFKMTPAGTLTVLHSFAGSDGASPNTLVQATNGLLYGTTDLGGSGNQGTIFSLDVGLGPFIETLPTFGKVGATVKILGTNLTGATSVTFNGTPATFTVVSPTLIKTTVPTGATTGSVQVVTPGGTLSSNTVFRIK